MEPAFLEVAPYRDRGRVRPIPGCPHCEADGICCPRCDAHERLPKARLLQAALTFISGAAHPGQAPLLRRTPARIVTAYFAGLVGVVAANAALVACFVGLAATKPVIWSVAIGLPIAAAVTALGMVTSGLLRGLHQYIMHNASHGNFGRYSRAVGETAVIVAGTLPHDEYVRLHAAHHSRLTKDDDGDQQAIAALGFVPGLPVEEYARQFRRALRPGRFFLAHLEGRWQCNFAADQPAWRKALVAAVHGLPLILTGGLVLGARSATPIIVYLAAWLIPWTYGIYASMVLYALGLHRWYHEAAPGMTARDAYLAKTGARFFADYCPSRGLSPLRRCLAWCRWWGRLIVLHLLVSKLFVIGPTDNQHHDAHHADASGRWFDWCHAPYSRLRFAASGPFRGKLWQTWTLSRAIRANFDHMSRLPRVDVAATSGGELPRALGDM